MEMHRNTRCWCGSGKKYKQCHEKFDEKLAKLAREGHIVPDRSLIKNRSTGSCRKAYSSRYEYR